MASPTDICNMALAHIGSDAIVTTISPPDGTVEAGFCARFYPIARTEMLDAYPYAFSKKRVTLAQADVNPSSVWTYAYALPSDCMNALRVLQLATLEEYDFYPFGNTRTADDFALFTERGSSDFETEGGLLLTHEPDAVLLYTSDVVDPSKFSPKLVTAMSYLLASFLAGPIVKGIDGINLASKMRQMAASVEGQAQVGDAANSSERAEHIPGSIRARA